MSDLFHKDVPDDYILAVAKVMAAANWHTYQVLTKRSERMRDLLSTKLRWVSNQKHIWWGVSVENRKHGLPRLEHLRSATAAVRFLSVEPLLEDLRKLNLRGIHWVIVGGESGPKARLMSPDWVRRIRDHCKESAVPFFFKQWGGVRKKETGRVLDDRTHDDLPNRNGKPAPDLNTRLELCQNLENGFASALEHWRQIGDKRAGSVAR